MGIRGNGLGLSWATISDMTEEAGSDGSVWTFDVVYKSSYQGFSGQDAEDWSIDTGEFFKFR